jgi:ABC-type phosphate/phosphonate transport system permease subunit
VRPALAQVVGAREVDRVSPVAMISFRCWQAQFGADRDVIGQTFRVLVSQVLGESLALSIVAVLLSAPLALWSAKNLTVLLLIAVVSNSRSTARSLDSIGLQACVAATRAINRVLYAHLFGRLHHSPSLATKVLTSKSTKDRNTEDNA